MKFHADDLGPASLPADADEFQVTIAAEPHDAEPDAEPGVDILVSDAPSGSEQQPLDGMPTIGHIGRYALKYRLGEGGLGTVYAAFDPLLSRGIALKTLHLEVPQRDRDAFEAMLMHEARAAASLSHPNIVTVYDAGLSDYGVYLAMERLQGRDLRRLLAQGWRPTVRQSAQIVRRVAEALAYAHHKGVVHCDIKPANIFMVSRTSPKVLDFGIARIAQHPDAGSAQARAAGSPYYMSPEQLRGDTLDRRCDVYSLGVVLYELLTGRRAYMGSTLEDIAEAVRSSTPTPPHELNPEVPRALSTIVARAMAKDPADRHRSARLLARDLRDWLGDRGVTRARRLRLTLAQATAGLVGALGIGFVAWGLWVQQPPSAAAIEADDARPAAGQAPPAAFAAADLPQATAPTAASLVDGASSAAQPASMQQATVAAHAAPAPKPSARRAAPRDPASATANAVPAPKGVVHIAVSPWGQVEVDGASAGTAPPLNRLNLTAGTHAIVIRNEDFPPFKATVNVSPDQPVTVKHRFGP